MQDVCSSHVCLVSYMSFDEDSQCYQCNFIIRQNMICHYTSRLILQDELASIHSSDVVGSIVTNYETCHTIRKSEISHDVTFLTGMTMASPRKQNHSIIWLTYANSKVRSLFEGNIPNRHRNNSKYITSPIRNRYNYAEVRLGHKLI